KGETQAPVAGGAAIIGKSIGEVILEVFAGGEIVAAAEDGYVPIIVVKASDLELSVGAQSTLGRNFFVPATFQTWTAIAPKHGRKGIEFIDRSGEFTADFAFVGLERSAGARLFREDHRGTPGVGQASIQLEAGPQRCGRPYHANKNVFGAVAKQR